VRYLNKYKIKTSTWRDGDILAQDIIVDGGKFICQDTTLNKYIIDKLLNNYIFEISVYREEEVSGEVNKKQDELKQRVKSSYSLSIFNIKRIINTITLRGTIDYEAISNLSNLVVEISKFGSNVVKYINTLKEVDEYTYTHCINVGIYASLIGNWMGLSPDKLKYIVQSGLLHDIGKLNIEESILKKPGKLTNSEFYEIKNHTIYGYDIVNNDENIDFNVKQAILMHHERIDGSGYPFGLLSYDIPLYAKLISVADVFDAMTCDRVYKKGVNPFRAFHMFLTEGITLFDTGVLYALLENLSAYYVGMKVLLDDGQVGEIVYIPPKNVLSPIIKIDEEFIDFSKESISRIIDVI
jgi:HD-GYP domain-containing protein (c-di-GMP phosphodiesterase class II)